MKVEKFINNLKKTFSDEGSTDMHNLQSMKKFFNGIQTQMELQMKLYNNINEISVASVQLSNK